MSKHKSIDSSACRMPTYKEWLMILSEPTHIAKVTHISTNKKKKKTKKQKRR